MLYEIERDNPLKQQPEQNGTPLKKDLLWKERIKRNEDR